MTIPPSSSYDWVREIKPELKHLDAIPLTASPPFPWDQLSDRLAQTFEQEGFTIQPREITWRSKDELFTGLGDAPYPLSFSIPSLQGNVYWLMPKQEINVLAAMLLTQDAHPLNLDDPSLIESFYRFFTLEVLYTITQLSYDPLLIPMLTSETNLPDQDSLCCDISLQMHNHSLMGRLVISPDFRRSWADYFVNKEAPSSLTQDMAQAVDVTVHIEAGKTNLMFAEWSAVQLGDFIILDNCTLDPESLEGRVMLTIQGKQAFRAKLKNGNLKILELPLMHEVDAPMANNLEDEDEDEDELSDFSLSDEEEHEDFSTFDEDEDLFGETEEEALTEEEMESQAPQPETQAQPPTTEAKAAPAPLKQQAGMISTDQIPVTVTVEIGRVQMSMDQLLHLEPGNMLELDIHPEKGVDLTINGKVVGKGELIRVGEALGVRILQLGK